MTAIETLLRQPAAQAGAWALLQFIWQGAAGRAPTALALAPLSPNAADVRYVVASIGMALMLTLPIVTGVQKYQTVASATFQSRADDRTSEPTVLRPGADR